MYNKHTHRLSIGQHLVIAGKYGVTPVITFDQPLFQKAAFIISSQNQSCHLRKIVLRQGGFHTQLSFLGCIGHLMSRRGDDGLVVRRGHRDQEVPASIHAQTIGFFSAWN